LSVIFDRDDLNKQYGHNNFDEKVFNPKEAIVSLERPQLSDMLLFVSRGKVVIKAGAYGDNTTPEYICKQGCVLNLHLLN
jgi:hypothetical protein